MKKVMKLGHFVDVYQVNGPTENHQVNLHFTVCEPNIIGYSFYVSYSFGKWGIDYAEEPVKMRTDMKSVSGIKTEKEMLQVVEKYLQELREKVAACPRSEEK